MSVLSLLAAALAAWRLAHMVTRERGPFDMFTRLRARFALGGLTSCPACASVWAAALCVGLLHTAFVWVVWVLAVSAAGLMLASWSGAHHDYGH
jgi:hypothetical protein